jgi:hypothetical protein
MALRCCAASVYRDRDRWQDIEGLQMEGGLQHLGAGKDSDRILLAYIAKFPTVKLLFNHSNLDLARFSELFHSQLYAFSPTRVFLREQSGYFCFSPRNHCHFHASTRQRSVGHVAPSTSSDPRKTSLLSGNPVLLFRYTSYIFRPLCATAPPHIGRSCCSALLFCSCDGESQDVPRGGSHERTG